MFDKDSLANEASSYEEQKSKCNTLQSLTQFDDRDSLQISRMFKRRKNEIKTETTNVTIWQFRTWRSEDHLILEDIYIYIHIILNLRFQLDNPSCSEPFSLRNELKLYNHCRHFIGDTGTCSQLPGPQKKREKKANKLPLKSELWMWLIHDSFNVCNDEMKNTSFSFCCSTNAKVGKVEIYQYFVQYNKKHSQVTSIFFRGCDASICTEICMSFVTSSRMYVAWISRVDASAIRVTFSRRICPQRTAESSLSISNGDTCFNVILSTACAYIHIVWIWTKTHKTTSI